MKRSDDEGKADRSRRVALDHLLWSLTITSLSQVGGGVAKARCECGAWGGKQTVIDTEGEKAISLIFTSFCEANLKKNPSIGKKTNNLEVLLPCGRGS